MKRKIQRRTNLAFTVFISALLIIIGGCLFFNPYRTFTAISMIVGVVLFTNAILSFLWIGGESNPQLRSTVIIRGAISIVVAVLLVISPFTFAETLWRMFMYFTAFFLIVTGVAGVFEIVAFRPIGYKLSLLVESILMIAAGLFFMLKPENIGKTILVGAGFGCVVCGALLLILSISRRYDLEEIR